MSSFSPSKQKLAAYRGTSFGESNQGAQGACRSRAANLPTCQLLSLGDRSRISKAHSFRTYGAARYLGGLGVGADFLSNRPSPRVQQWRLRCRRGAFLSSRAAIDRLLVIAFTLGLALLSPIRHVPPAVPSGHLLFPAKPAHQATLPARTVIQASALRTLVRGRLATPKRLRTPAKSPRRAAEMATTLSIKIRTPATPRVGRLLLPLSH